MRPSRPIYGLGLTVLLLAGCATTGKRCEQIHRDDVLSDLMIAAEERRIRDGGAYDPTFRPSPLPPRPSDHAWYAEHCYEGKSR